VLTVLWVHGYELGQVRHIHWIYECCQFDERREAKNKLPDYITSNRVWEFGQFGGGSLAPHGKSLARPGNLANSVALEPTALVLLAPFISAISAAAAAAAAVAAAVAAAAAAAGESRCV
jgi:hypothetical protein